MIPRHSLLLPSLLLAVACGGFDQGVKAVNNAPTVTISSPSDGGSLVEGFSTGLRGSASDLDDAPEDLLATWLVNGNPIEGCVDLIPESSGVVSCDYAATIDATTITLEVRDPANATGAASVAVSVVATEAPTADITAPEGTGVYYADQLISLAGLALDAEDDPAQLQAVWESDKDGVLDTGAETPDSSGALMGTAMLSEGDHTLTLTVTDSTGKTARDSVAIHVGAPNSPPNCTIVLPADGGSSEAGSTVLFEAVATDVDIPAEWLTVEWTSDKDGLLGTSTPDSAGDVNFSTNTLSVATHTIQMTVTDEIGATCTASILYTVGTPPTLIITAPADGAVINEGTPVTFTGEVHDSEDAAPDIDLSWESDVDGIFSTVGADSSGAIAFSTGALSPGGHFITVRATDTAGLFVQETLNLTVNEVPTAAAVSLAPSAAYTDSTLTATASGSSDPDGFGTLAYTYAWYKNGALSSASTSDTLPASATTKHDLWTVEATPTDGYGDGPAATASVTILNSAPVLTGPSLSSSTLTVGTTLTCSATASDADADTLTTSISWKLGSTGAPLGTGSTYTLGASTATAGDTIVCTYTVNDGDGGVATGTASATVQNTAPVVNTVTVTPGSATTGSTLTCAATASDADGPTPTLSYSWVAPSGAVLGSSTTLTLTSSNSEPGDAITCKVTATDSSGATGLGSASATVLNTNPSVSSVTISPSTAYNTDTLTCAAAASDADGQTLSTAYTWTNTTTGVTLGTSASITLSSATASSQDGVRCAVVVSDPSGGTSSGSASQTLGNREPTLSAGPTITPTSPAAGDTLTCAATGADADSDSVSLSYVWTRGGSTVGTGATYSGTTIKGQTYTCTVTPDDAKGSGSGTAGSASVTIGNTAPTVSAVTLSPTSPRTNDTITASVTATDPDGDAVSITYTWYVNGSIYTSGPTSTLSGITSFSKTDTIYVVVTPTDGTSAGASKTSSAVTVLNTTPTAPTVTISPSAPAAATDDLVCLVSTASSDADSDTITYTASWTKNGAAWTGGTTTTFSGDTVPAASTSAGELWVCTVTPNDGTAAGTAASASVTIGSALPDLIVDGTSLTVVGGTYTYDEVMVINGGTLYITDAVVLNANSFYVEAGAKVSGDGAGSAGGTSASRNGVGTGGGTGSSNAGGGGGGHGGAGGRGGYDSGDTVGSGGSAFGSTTSTSTEVGSGGAAGGTLAGGDGGGALTVHATDIVVDGTITMDGDGGGGPGGQNGGGGAGGGILLICETLDFTGLLSADGGRGGSGTAEVNDDGGGGGGGIIKVFYDSGIINTGTMTVTGGTVTTNGDINAVAGSAGSKSVTYAAYP